MCRAPKYFQFLRGSTLWLLVAVPAAPVNGQDDPTDLLRSVSRKVIETVNRLPKYVCTLTVDRIRYDPQRLTYGRNGEPLRHSCDDISAKSKAGTWNRTVSMSDRLRLDVAVNREVSGIEDEMYSWVGAGRFSDRTLFDLVPEGAVSTGSFASILASIFGGKGAQFSYDGDSAVNGKTFAEFAFHIPEGESDYRYLYGTGRHNQTAIAYGGTLMVDPQSSAIVRLVIHARALPEATGACELTQTLDYDRVRLDGAEFLLPEQVRLVVTHLDGSQAENVIHYSACHEFKGESTVRFDAAEEPPRRRASDVGPATLSLPPGLPFRVAFTDRIDPATAAAGDAIRGRLKAAIRDGSGQILAPEGATVAGRILSIKRFYGIKNGERPGLVLAVRLEGLDLAGRLWTLHAKFDNGLHRYPKSAGGLVREMKIGRLDPTQDPEAGVFEFWDRNGNFVIDSGMESNWITRTP